MSFKKSISITLIIIGIALIGLSALYFRPQPIRDFINPLADTQPTPAPKPWLRYTFTNLRNTPPQSSQINRIDLINQESEYTAYVFEYQSENSRITGQLNLPSTATPAAGFPVIVMLRGFVPPEIYQTGIGTRNAAAAFAKAGYITLSPDFLGFGESDPPPADSIGARVIKPKNVIDLLASIRSLENANLDAIGIWGHSNGGQIALSVLQITGESYPTTLWAPVSKSFPYSVLYYTDESPDQGKALRKVVSQFEEQYDVFDYSIDRYYEWITAPLQLHQGTADDAIPVAWSDQLNQTLIENDVEVNYFRYPSADHNLRPDWNTVVNRDIAFFDQYLKNQ